MGSRRSSNADNNWDLAVLKDASEGVTVGGLSSKLTRIN